MSEENTEVTPNEEPASLLDDATPTLEDGEWFQSDGVKGVGDAPEWYQAGHFTNVNEQAKAYGELHKKFGGFSGAPKDGYQLSEGIEKDDELTKAYVEFATDSNMNQEAFNKGFELLQAQMEANEEINEENEIAKLGDNAGQRIKNVESALKFKLGDQYDSVKELVTNADSIILVEKLIKAYAPTKLPIDGGENPTGVTWEEISKMLHEKDEHGNFKMSVDREHKAKYDRLLKEYGGDKPNLVTVG